MGVGMTTTEIAQALEAWAVATVPELNSYEHAPAELTEALPLVLAEVKAKRRRPPEEPEDFRRHQYQQVTILAWTVELMILVDPSDTWTASQTLYDMTDALGAAIKADRTLGGRVQFASGRYDVSFDPPEVEYSDGTVARAATMTVTVGEQEEA